MDSWDGLEGVVGRIIVEVVVVVAGSWWGRRVVYGSESEFAGGLDDCSTHK